MRRASGDNYERPVGPPIELDVSDPIDRILYKTYSQVKNGKLRHDDEAEWILGVQKGEKRSAALLVAGYRPVVASVGYAYKARNRDSKRIIYIGANALINSANLFDSPRSGDYDFLDAATFNMHLNLQSTFGFRPEGLDVIYTEDAESNIKAFYDRIATSGLAAQYRDYMQKDASSSEREK